MKRKITAILLMIAMTAVICVGCAETGDWELFDYDLKKYVTVGQYMGLPAVSYEFSFTQEDLEAGIAEILSSYSELVEVTDRAVKTGDTVNIDYEGFFDDVAFEGGTGTGYNLEIGSGGFISGFEDGLIGAETGQTLTVEATFPDPYTTNPDYAGKTAKFIVTINSISENVTPEYNEDFLAEHFPDYATFEEFEAYVRTASEENFNYEMEMDIIDQVWGQVMANSSTIKYPEREYNKFFDEDMEYYENYCQSNFLMPLEDYLVEYEYTTLDEFKETIGAGIKSYIDEQLVFLYIVRAEKLELSDEEFEAGLEQYGADLSMTRESLITNYGEDYLRNNIHWEKVLRYLVDNAVVTVEPA